MKMQRFCQCGVFLFFIICEAAGLGLSTALAQEETPVKLPDVGFDQKLGEELPLDALFTNEEGEVVRLGDLLEGKPAVLALVYYECPMLCTFILNGLVEGLEELKFTVGDEFNAIAVSFNPRETPELARKKKENYLKGYSRTSTGSGWHFLTGGEDAISRLTQAAGFRYSFEEKSGQYAHPSGIMVVTQEGKIARYLFGISYPVRDLQFALMEASEKRIGSFTDQILLSCYHYNPVTGKYGLAIMNIVRAGGLMTVLAIFLFIFVNVRRDLRTKSRTMEML